MTRSYTKIEGELAREILRLANLGYAASTIDKILNLSPGAAWGWLKRKGYR